MSKRPISEGGLTRAFPAMSVLMWDRDKATRLGATIKSLRTAAGMSQESFAYQAGLTKNQIQLIESGRGAKKGDTDGGPSNPGIASLDGVATALNISVAELLTAARL